MAHRADLNALSAAERQVLVNLMLPYLTDAVVAQHTAIIHTGEEIFTGHRAYIADMETHLAATGGAAFVPLPMWDPATPIPPEFNVVKPQDDSTPRPPLVNLNPGLPMPAEWDYPAVCEFESAADLGNAINGWHGGVHGAIGGTMGAFSIASAAPIFWCWHAFVDHIYWNWQLCQVTCPDVKGCSLQYAKLKLRQNGLCDGTVTHIPRYLVPPERLPKRQTPDPRSYVPSVVAPRPEEEEYEYAGVTSIPRRGRGRKPGHLDAMGPGPIGAPTVDAGHDHVHDTGRGGHDGGHTHPAPVPSYTQLTTGPVVLSQYPAAGTTACVKSNVDLIVVVD